MKDEQFLKRENETKHQNKSSHLEKKSIDIIQPIKIEIIFGDNNLNESTKEHLVCNNSSRIKQTLLTTYFKVDANASGNQKSIADNQNNLQCNVKRIKKNFFHRKILKKYSLHRIKKWLKIINLCKKLSFLFRLHRKSEFKHWKRYGKNESILFAFICIDIYNKYTNEIIAMQTNIVHRRTNSIELNYINRRLQKIMPSTGSIFNDDATTNHSSDLQNKRYKTNKQTDNARLLIVSDTKDKDHSKFIASLLHG